MTRTTTERPNKIEPARSNAALRVHAIWPNSRANGPGRRFVIWVQGCSLGCPGCFNPETHAFNDGTLIPIPELFAQIEACGDSIEGITVSGGEPFQQIEGVAELLRAVKAHTDLSVIVFTGFDQDEAASQTDWPKELWPGLIDVLISGRYDASHRLARGLQGSSNKRIQFLTDRYRASDLVQVPEAEILIGEGGTMIGSGIDPVRFAR